MRHDHDRSSKHVEKKTKRTPLLSLNSALEYSVEADPEAGFGPGVMYIDTINR